MIWFRVVPFLACVLLTQGIYVDITLKEALTRLHLDVLIDLVEAAGLSQTLDDPSDITLKEALTRLHLDVLIDLVEAAGLSQTLDDPSANLTLLAPINFAITTGLRNLGLSMDQIKQDKDALKDILLYHVIPGRHTIKDFTNERIFTTASGDKLRTNHYLSNNFFYVDGARIFNRDVETKNGVLHTINGILFPFEGNVYEIIANNTDLSTLKAAIDATGLAPVLKDQNPITIFCPTNDAFAKLGDLVQKLLNNPALLKEILLYHVIPGSLYKGDFHDTSLHTFDENDRIELDHHTTYNEVDDARFTKYDISASNGVLHKIQSVLVPDSLLDQIKNL